MGKIEELPDDFDESLDLNKSAPTTTDDKKDDGSAATKPAPEAPFPIDPSKVKPADPMAPELPPAIAAVRSHTTEELADMMKKTPLFMTDINDAGDDEEANNMLDAIRALQHEGTRGEAALNFREQGNEAAKVKDWKNAKEYYNKGLAVLNVKPGSEQDKWEKPKDEKEEERMQREAREACLINRALCNLELKNYRSTTLDCAAVLKLNPRNVKAYYRSASALLALDKIEEAQDAASRGLAVEPSNIALKKLAEKIAERKAVLDRIAAKKREEEERRQKEQHLLRTALRARSIRIRRTDQPPDLQGAKVHLSPDPLSPESTLCFPTMILYPLEAQTDFIQAFSESDRLLDHFRDYLLPPPWDTRGAYEPDKVDCYMETVTGGLIKVGKKVPLLQILSGGKVEVVDELVKIIVVPTAEASRFIEDFKARKAGTK
ncbi:hypothetical protein VTN49DRAFT_5602 [Thermomyces lanuginosus]|uniref:uncharacterized protein n=1 Tax=Thermomyces lanuginosus TaxID=5541 RepID=UPI003744208B